MRRQARTHVQSNQTFGADLQARNLAKASLLTSAYKAFGAETESREEGSLAQDRALDQARYMTEDRSLIQLSCPLWNVL